LTTQDRYINNPPKSRDLLDHQKVEKFCHDDRNPSTASEDMDDRPARKPRLRQRNRGPNMASAEETIRNNASDHPVRHLVLTNAHILRSNANHLGQERNATNTSTASKDMTGKRARKPRWRHRGSDQAAVGGMNRNEASDQPVRISFHTNAHSFGPNANHPGQERNNAHQDANMAHAVETNRNEESASSVSDLNFLNARDAALDTNDFG
jgi:hypothetical protein